MRSREGSGGAQQFILAIVSIVVAILAVVNVVLFETTRTVQLEVTSRAQFLQQTAQIEPLYRELVQGIATMAARNNDEALRGVLSQHGITFTVPSGPGSAPAPAPGLQPTPSTPGGGRP